MRGAVYPAALAISAVALLVLLWLWARSRSSSSTGLELGFGKVRVPKGVPPWAGFFKPEQYRAFLDAVELALVDRELEAVGRDGVVAVALPDGRPLQLGLQNLAQQCARLPRQRWATTIGDHVDTLLRAEAETDAFDRTDFEAVKSLLKVRLYPAEGVADSEASAVVLARPAAGLVGVLVYDLPHTVASVPPEEVAAWGRSESELLALGLQNLAAEPAPKREDVEVERGVVLRLVSGPSFFVASHLLCLERLLPQKLEYGALVCVPTRHLLLVHAIRDSRVLMAVNALIPQSYLYHQRGPGSLSPNLYWWHDGQLTHLPTSVERDAVKFTPPPEFVERVMEPMGS
jgi:hypothetical protein